MRKNQVTNHEFPLKKTKLPAPPKRRSTTDPQNPHVLQKALIEPKTYAFLECDGEMGELTRNFEWSNTSLGSIDEWPQSLCTTISIILHSKFPMFLFWGPDHICFYNDAYRPSLGNQGKHPGILGMPGKEAWPEIWDFIGPMISDILAGGEATWYEDQSLPIYRNGQMEDVYWTFSYSPVSDESGKRAGVFVTCTETTKAVQSFQKMKESEDRFRTMAEGSDVLIAMSDETSHATYFNKAWVTLTGRPMDELLNFGWVDLVHPDDRERYFNIYLEAFEAREPFTGDFRIQDAAGSYCWLLARGTPRFTADGSFAGYISSCIDVTKQKLQQDAIRRSEARFRTLVEKAISPILILKGEDMVLEMANQPLFDAWRVGEEALGKPFLEILPEMADQPFIHWMRHVYHTGEPVCKNEVPAYFSRADGEPQTKYWNFVYQPYYDEDGTISGILAQATEITEQVLARKKVEQSEAHQELLSDTVPAMIFYLDAEQRYQSYNERFMEWFGVGRTEAIGKTVREFIGEEAYQVLFPHLAKAYGGQQERFEMQAPSRLDNRRWLSIVYTPHKAEDGEVLGVIVHATDITDSKQTEIALRESEARFRSLIEEAPVATCLFVGPEMKIALANEKMIKFWGKDDAVIGMNLKDAVPELLGQPFLGILDDVFASGKTYEAKGARAMLEQNGVLGTYYFDYTYKPLFDAAGKVYGIMDMAVDVTAQVLARQQIEEVVAQRTRELAEANDALQAINGELQRSNSHLEEFAHAASHDLKEPIRKIHYFTSRLQDQLELQLNKDQSFLFARITNATERMGLLIDDLLLYSHVSHKPHEKEPVDLAEQIKRVIEDLELDIQEKQASIHVGKLPVVTGYRRQMQQLFQNLLTNAIKYSKKDVPPRIEISGAAVTENGRSYHLIEVSDNGIGFEQQYAERIFQMFTRLHGKAEYSGTGIGLAIVKKVLENHGGFIRVQTALNEGSVFKVYLPA